MFRNDINTQNPLTNVWGQIPYTPYGNFPQTIGAQNVTGHNPFQGFQQQIPFQGQIPLQFTHPYFNVANALCYPNCNWLYGQPVPQTMVGQFNTIPVNPTLPMFTANVPYVNSPIAQTNPGLFGGNVPYAGTPFQTNLGFNTVGQGYTPFAGYHLNNPWGLNSSTICR